MYMVCYLGAGNTISVDREFGTLAEAREYIRNLGGHTPQRFILKREWTPGD
jgi:hypothetical protein